MSMTRPSCQHRAGRSSWSVLGFFAGSVVILWLVMDRCLIPAIRLSDKTSPVARKQLAAISALVLVIVLVCLLVGLVLVVRPGRFFVPDKASRRTRTRYVDAWTESGRRMEAPPPEPDDEEPQDRPPSSL